MRKILIFAAAFCAGLTVFAAEIPGVPRDSNFGNTSGYDATRVNAWMNINVSGDTRELHFIRDNNDPRVVTKTYILKNVDAYEFRDYLRQMVQSKRVGNASVQQQYPGNTAGLHLSSLSLELQLSGHQLELLCVLQVQSGKEFYF